ncbi:sigma 54-interacting transcriptional regulator [Halalkalibacter oceani]|uniref:sigma 54-interacting transcriptional regulator n=1 Tax=Halalkalibacter oceani TaxID=1653776 RepID=UPI003394A7B9
MSEIVILAPINELVEVAQEACEKTGEQIPIKKVSLAEAVHIAKQCEQAGAEIIISRGTVGSTISGSDITIPVVQIPITGYDLLRTIMKAFKYGMKVGIADTAEVLQGVESIEASLGRKIEKVQVNTLEEVKAGVAELLERKIDVLIGKNIYVNEVKETDVKTVMLSSGVESVIQAINEAKSLIDVRRAEISRTKQLKAILDFIAEGVIAVDDKGIITVCNPPVSNILNIPYDRLIGRPIEEVFSNSRIKKVIATGKEELNRIQEENGVKIITNQIPIRHENSVFGAVCTFQELQVLQRQEQEIRKKLLHRGHVTKYRFENIVGKSPVFLEALEKVRRYSQVDSTVLLTGETGVGKEVFAHLLHAYSKRSDGPFVAVNCAAIPANLLESELFGYVDGAFTGARKGGKTGLFELAHRGTIFLDEIGELDESLQAQLLRVLQEGEVMRLGDERVIPIDIRVIAASNRDFAKMMEEAKFRADLYYRLNILDIIIPALRERADDIPLLCDYFIAELTPSIQREIKGFDQEALTLLQRYQWPGNIRQLRNVVERSMILSPESTISAETVKVAGGKDFADYIAAEKGEAQDQGKLQNFERDYILQVLKQVNGNKTEAAKILGIGRTTLWRKINNK